MIDQDELLIPYRLRLVRIGVQATYLVIPPVVLFGFLSIDDRGRRTAYVITCALALAGALGISRLPWQRLFERGQGVAFMYGWSVLDITLVTALIGISGEAALFLLYAFTTIFSGAAYPLRSQLLLFVLTAFSYLGILQVTDQQPGIGLHVLWLSLLAAFLYMTSFIARELMEQMAAHGLSRQESQRRAMLLETVAAAARRMTVLGPDEVFKVVVDAATLMRLDAASIVVFNEDQTSYRSVASRGLPDDYTQQEHPADSGVAGMVLERQTTVIVDDDASDPRAVASLQEEGFRSVIATPIWSERKVAAVLVCGTRRVHHFTHLDTEALQLLAAQAGRALETARRFEEQQHAVERLAELDRLKQEFLTTVSHELRTPLTAVEGMGLTLERHWNVLDDETRRDLLERLNANASTLHGIVATLLDFSRLEHGRLEVKPEDIDLEELIKTAVSRLESLFRDHLLQTHYDEDLRVRADPWLLDRVIENLLSNAAKYTPHGTLVELSARAMDGSAVVTVSDRGPGIPEHELEHLGELFFRGGDLNDRAIRGTGLGLAFVNQILALHGTQLEISSRVGEGSTFVFRLPLLRASTHV